MSCGFTIFDDWEPQGGSAVLVPARVIVEVIWRNEWYSGFTLWPFLMNLVRYTLTNDRQELGPFTDLPMVGPIVK